MKTWLAIVVAAALCLTTTALWAAPPGQVSITDLGFSQLEMKAGHSLVVKLPRDVKRVSVGKPEVADVLVLAPRQLYVNAKGVGTTNISLWDGQNAMIGVFEVRVARDLTRLKEHLYKIMPTEQVEVREMEGAVLLSGRVSSAQAKAQAEAVAKAFAPKQVTSVLEVGGTRQVVLKVRFAEVNRKALNRLNFNLGFFNPAGAFGFTFLNNLVNTYDTSIGLDSFVTRFDFARNLNGMFGFPLGGAKVMGFLEALKQQGLAKILAEPNLVATSGEKAEFLAGGEYPIPVPQRDNVTILFKKFGVQLTFLPIILPDGRIQLQVEPEVSELDYSTAVVINNFTVPGLITRRAKTQLELDDNQSFAIAGLFRDDITQTVGKIPLLGDIPILGALFRSTEFQTKQTELVIVVTPELVRPGSHPVKSPLPGENLKAPNLWKLFLFAEFPHEEDPHATPDPQAPQTTQQSAIPHSMREMEGDFGHAMVY
ncbi:MAG: type II and III secretion system protein family protein [Deltaproteobacteria bacterium]|nr:type II and III secretion system protein family protein [Deltaproteobacteria bacterium]